MWCRVLSFAKIYMTTCTYCWMFCEGFYLHQLITNTFEPPKSLTSLYLFGWRKCFRHKVLSFVSSCRLAGSSALRQRVAGRERRSCSTFSPVSSRMGDRLRAGKPSGYRLTTRLVDFAVDELITRRKHEDWGLCYTVSQKLYATDF